MLHQPRLILFTLLFSIDVYDTYLHKYPAPPKQEEIYEVVEKGAFAKYEGCIGRLFWMALSYIAWLLLFQKNIILAKEEEPLANYELFFIILAISGFLLRVWSKRVLRKYYTYRIILYKDHEVIDDGPYSMIRHPGMCGMLMNWMGICCWANHWWGWALYVLLLRDTYHHTLSEEKEFKKHLQQYTQYMTQVPSRFVPFIF
eukprot:240006_1